MKNFKQNGIRINRNEMRYLTTNPFKGIASIQVEDLFKSKAFIKNKLEKYTELGSTLFYELNISNKVGLVYIFISKDHLIDIKVYYNKFKKLKTRSIEDMYALINEVLFT